MYLFMTGDKTTLESQKVQGYIAECFQFADADPNEGWHVCTVSTCIHEVHVYVKLSSSLNDGNTINTTP